MLSVIKFILGVLKIARDGIGDLQGIIEKLPYLKELGVDFYG